MSKWYKMSKNRYTEEYKGPRGLILLIITLGILVITIALFALLPPSVQIETFKVPVVSTAVGFTIAALGNIVISLIQRQTSKEASNTLEEPLDHLSAAIKKIEQIHFFHERGVEGIFSNRNEAMPHFLKDIEKEKHWIGIVGTSLLGAIDPSNRNEEKQKLVELLLKKKKDNVRIDSLLMHPAYGEFRERVENRSRAAVSKDIQNSLASMVQVNDRSENNVLPGRVKNIIFDYENIKLYPGVITAFAIFTKNAVLLNTSTLTGPVYDNVVFIIRDTNDANSIYKKFRASHFDEPWKSEKTIQLNEELLKKLLAMDFAKDDFRFKEGNWPKTIGKELGSHVAGASQEEHTAYTSKVRVVDV